MWRDGNLIELEKNDKQKLKHIIIPKNTYYTGRLYPEVPCVYFLIQNDKVTYIGQTKNLKNRIIQHESEQQIDIWLGDKKIYSEEEVFDGVFYYPLPFGSDVRIMVESELIRRYYPKMNYTVSCKEPYNIDEMKPYVEGWIKNIPSNNNGGY